MSPAAMDFLSSSPPTTSDDSSCDDSTGPITPDSSPMFGASRVEDLIGTPLAHYLDSPKKHEAGILSADGLRFTPPVSLRELSFGKPVRHIAVVGAGYVGRSCRLYQSVISSNGS